MRWDQGILTFVLVVAVTLIGFAACGPSSSKVSMLPNAKTGRVVDPCAAKIGSRSEKVVGGEKKAVEIPVCGLKIDGDPKSKAYEVVPMAVGYKVGANEKKLSVTIEVGVELPSAIPDEDAGRVVDLITRTCRDKILKLWSDSRMDSGLTLVLEAVLSNSTAAYDHVLYLDGSVRDGFVMAHWPDRARLKVAAKAEAFSKCGNFQRGEDRTKCRRSAVHAGEESNSDFCIQLTQMTAHYLGLATEEAKAGKCDVKAQPVASKAGPVRHHSILDAFTDPELKGEKFWTQARFTPADRKTIMDAACAN